MQPVSVAYKFRLYRLFFTAILPFAAYAQAMEIERDEVRVSQLSVPVTQLPKDLKISVLSDMSELIPGIALIKKVEKDEILCYLYQEGWTITHVAACAVKKNDFARYSDNQKFFLVYGTQTVEVTKNNLLSVFDLFVDVMHKLFVRRGIHS